MKRNKVKCAGCEATIFNPRSDKAIAEGWSTIDATLGRGTGSEHISLSVCPKHKGTLVKELDDFIEKWKKRRGIE